MSVVFRSTPKPTLQNIKPAITGLIYPSAYVKVISNGITLDGTLSQYSDGRYKPYLLNTAISVEGSLGMLTRAEITFAVDTDTDFETYTAAFLVPNQKVKIEYGWRSPHPGWGSNGQSGALSNMVIYDFSFEYLSDIQRYQCSFRAMNATSTIDEVEYAINLPSPYSERTFLTENVLNVNKSNKVTSISDLILSYAQNGQSDPFDEPSSPSVVNVTDEGASEYVLAVPFKNQNEDDKSAAGNGVRVYVNLGFIVNVILNKIIVPHHTKTALFADNPKFTYKLQESIDITGLPYLFSPNPLEVVFPGTNDISSTYGPKEQVSITFKDVFTNGFTPCISDNKLFLKNILISLDTIIALEKEVASIKDQRSKAESTDESSRSNVLLSVKDFIKKISAIINKNSGGLIDLVTYHPEDTDSTVISLADRNYRGDVASAKPLVFNNRYPGDGVTMTANIKAEVPKDMIAQNAYFNNIKGLTAAQIQKANKANSESVAAAKKAEIDRKVKYRFAESVFQGNIGATPREKLGLTKFTEQSIESAAKLVRQYVQNRPVEIASQQQNAPYPLKLSLVVAGVHGFKFGDLITLKYLPYQYKDLVCFRVLRIKHSFQDMSWTTELETVCDLI